ncbi:MAG: peptide deformylase [Candidatus Dojkabacteria bacterium]|nr:MAG: peptide deformylase [Candidatus Dojkabacteria bacterium]
MKKDENKKQLKYLRFPVLHIGQNEKQLREPSKPVDLAEVGTAEFEDFLEQLFVAMHSEPMREGWMAAGISAVQVGVPKQVFYAYNSNTETYDIFINPQVEYLGEAQDIKIESCLSIPDVIGGVRRHKRIRVSYYDREGQKQRKTFTGWNARVIQHEYDHLQGVLFTDKIVEGYSGEEYA